MKRVTFLAKFHDGDHEMRGYEFAINECAYVVHKGREPYDKHYFVSCKTTGARLGEVKATSQRQAILDAGKILKGKATV